MKLTTTLRQRLLTALLALVSASAWAADYPALQLNEEFTITYKQTSQVWTYTATQDGVVQIVGADPDVFFSPCLNVYDSLDFSKQGIEMYYFAPSHYEFQVQADSTYYIKNNNWSGSDMRAKLVMGQEFLLASVDPADGSVFTLKSNGNIQLLFTSSSVTFTEGELTAAGNVIKVYNFTDYNDLVREGIFTYSGDDVTGQTDWNGQLCAHTDNGIVVELITQTGTGFYNVLNRLFEEGKLQAGDPLSLDLHGIQNTLTGDLLNGDGNLSLSWTFAGAPTTLVSAQLPNPIQSWYNEGDPAALCTYTFTKDIQSARARLEMGQGEGTEDLYQEYIADDHISFDGKTVKVDLSGVMRTQQTMNLKYSWSEFTVVLFDVIDTDGNETFCEDQGAVSSYKYTTPFKDITGTISAEFSPASGAAITEATKEIEIWFNNSSLIQWDGVTFTYYTMEEVSDVDEAGQPVVTMQNVAHEVFVPKADLTAETIDNETTITVPVPAGLCQATDIRVAVNITGSTDGAYHVIVAYYNNTLSHDLDLARFATPADQTTVGLLHEIYLTLGMTHAINTKVSQPVKVTGTATKFGCSGKVVGDGMMGVKIVLDEYITAPDTYVVTIAEGVVGDYVYGESDYKSGLTNTACTLTYTVNGLYAGKPVIIDPAEGPVERLQHFTLEFFEYASVAPTWNMEAQPYVEDADGVRTDAEFQEMMDAGNVVAIRLSKEITADGTYTLVVPAGAVCNGAQGDPLETEYRFTYTIGEPTAIGSIHATPASTTAIYTVSGQRVTKANAPGLYIVGGKKVVVK